MGTRLLWPRHTLIFTSWGFFFLDGKLGHSHKWLQHKYLSRLIYPILHSQGHIVTVPLPVKFNTPLCSLMGGTFHQTDIPCPKIWILFSGENNKKEKKEAEIMKCPLFLLPSPRYTSLKPSFPLERGYFWPWIHSSFIQL